jgi:peroxiredoxin
MFKQLKYYLTTILIVISFGFTSCIHQDSSNDNIITAEFNHPIKVLLFMYPGCPISSKLIPSLNSIYQNHKDSISFLGIIPIEVSKKEIKKFTKDYNISFQVIYDESCYYSNLYQISVVPQCVVLRHDSVYYQGAISNHFLNVGVKNKSEVNLENYLRSQLNCIFEGCKVNHVKPVGCLVSCTN